MVVACRRKDDEKILYKHNLIILPQLYQTEVLFKSHDPMGHQGIDKVQQRILHRFDWPGLREGLREMGQCMTGISTGERPKEGEVPSQVR